MTWRVQVYLATLFDPSSAWNRAIPHLSHVWRSCKWLQVKLRLNHWPPKTHVTYDLPRSKSLPGLSNFLLQQYSDCLCCVHQVLVRLLGDELEQKPIWTPGCRGVSTALPRLASVITVMGMGPSGPLAGPQPSSARLFGMLRIDYEVVLVMVSTRSLLMNSFLFSRDNRPLFFKFRLHCAAICFVVNYYYIPHQWGRTWSR